MLLCYFFQLCNKIIKTNASSNKSKFSDDVKVRDTIAIDVNELETMLPSGDADTQKEKEKNMNKKNHEINGEICLLVESPFRILRVSLHG